MFPDFLTSDFDRLNPFARACRRGDLTEARQLAKKLPRRELNRPSLIRRETPLHLAIIAGDYLELVEFLVNELGQKAGIVSIELAVQHDRIRVFQFLLNSIKPKSFKFIYTVSLIYGRTSLLDLALSMQGDNEPVLLGDYLSTALSVLNFNSVSYLVRSGHLSVYYQQFSNEKEKELLNRVIRWLARVSLLFAMSRGDALNNLKYPLKRSIVEFL